MRSINTWEIKTSFFFFALHPVALSLRWLADSNGELHTEHFQLSRKAPFFPSFRQMKKTWLAESLKLHVYILKCHMIESCRGAGKRHRGWWNKSNDTNQICLSHQTVLLQSMCQLDDETLEFICLVYCCIWPFISFEDVHFKRRQKNWMWYEHKVFN